jgi:hypothetical protein
MSFSVHRPYIKFTQFPGGGTVNNNIDISAQIDISATIYTDICQYDATYWQNVNKTIGKVMLADSMNQDAFGRLRVSNPITLFDGKMVDSSQSLIFDTSFGNGGRVTYLPNESAMRMDVSQANSFVIRQSHYFAQYQPGKSLAAMGSFYFGNVIPVGAYRRIGFFENSEGIFFQQDSSGLSWRIRSVSAPSITVYQNNWNIDKLDGTGPSGLTISMGNTNLMFIDIEWLGVGRVRTGFYLGGILVYCHQFAQTLTSVYMRSPANPVRYEIGTTLAQSFDISMKQICCTILSEGGYEQLGFLRSYLNESTVSITATDPYTHILSLRLKPGYSKGALLKVLNYELIGGGGTTLFVKILRNATLTGATWFDINSYSQVATGAGVTVSGGDPIGTGFVVNSQRFLLTEIPDNILVFQGDIDGVPDIFTIEMKSSSGSKTVNASITWQEIV